MFFFLLFNAIGTTAEQRSPYTFVINSPTKCKEQVQIIMPDS